MSAAPARVRREFHIANCHLGRTFLHAAHPTTMMMMKADVSMVSMVPWKDAIGLLWGNKRTSRECCCCFCCCSVPWENGAHTPSIHSFIHARLYTIFSASVSALLRGKKNLISQPFINHARGLMQNGIFFFVLLLFRGWEGSKFILTCWNR